MARKRRSQVEDGEPDEQPELTISLEDSDDGGSAARPPVTLGAPGDEPEFSFSLEDSDEARVSRPERAAPVAAEEGGAGLGALAPRYDLLLNRAAARPFPRCPRCSAKTGRRSLSIFALVQGEQPLLFAHRGPLCPACGLFIIHAAELEVAEEVLASVEFLGTIEAGFARLCEREPRPLEELLAHLADFKSFSVIRDRGDQPGPK